MKSLSQNSDKFLSPNDLLELTGVQKPSAQKRVLEKNRIYYVERSDGTVIVTWYAVHHPMISSANDEGDINWEAVS